MSLLAECDLLASIPLFRGIDLAKRKLVAMSSDRINFVAGDTVFNEGDVADAVFMMIQGQVKVIKENAEASIELAEIKGSALLGETGVILTRRRSATIVAIADCTMLRIEGQVFIDLLEQVPQITLALARELAERLERSNNQILARSLNAMP